MTPVVDRLPADPGERRALLDTYFPRRLADAAQRHDGRWDVSVRPFDEAAMHVDPELHEGLRWWDATLRIADIPSAVRVAGRSLLSLEDAWTAVALSRWLEECPNRTMTILHVDDHTDLMEPLLARRETGTWTDLVRSADVDLRRPDTVAAAVMSGAIGVASFFAPFIHEVASGEIRHLRATSDAASAEAKLLVPINRMDDLLAPDTVRPGVELATHHDGSTGGWRYRVAADPNGWLKDLPLGPLFLHIDFDYFCNRFNGDSDWLEHPRPNDVCQAVVKQRVTALIAAIAEAGIAEYITSVSGALSPGFFPAGYWSDAVHSVHAGLTELGVDLTGWL